MAAPVQVTIPADAWTEVATNVTQGVIKIKDPIVSRFYCTFVNTGDSAPTGDQNIDEAWQLNSEEQIIAAQAGIDAYMYCLDRAGRVVVSV